MSSIVVSGGSTELLRQIIAGRSRQIFAMMTPNGSYASGFPTVDSAGGAVAAFTDTGSAGLLQLQTPDLALSDGALQPRLELTASAAQKFGGIAAGRVQTALPLLLGPNPPGVSIKRSLFGTFEVYDSVRVDAVAVAGDTIPVFAWAGCGYRVNANGYYWMTGVSFFAQCRGGLDLNPNPGAPGSPNWQACVGQDSVNNADPTPHLVLQDLGIPWNVYQRLGLAFDAVDDDTPRIRWIVNGQVVHTHLGVLSQKFDKNANGLVNNLPWGYGLFKQDNTTVDSIQMRYMLPQIEVYYTPPVL
jgi:hypothetical protein